MLLGHKDPDTDCIASLVAFALFLSKLNKAVTVYLSAPVQAQFSYLLAICKYNGIQVAYGNVGDVSAFSTAIMLDTPKPNMVAANDHIAAHIAQNDVLKIEIDHHLKGDAQYIGDDGYCLVSEASSTCELIGYFLLKMAQQKERFKDIELFTRNISLAILTGIVGDSHLGKYLTTRKEKYFYEIFTKLFNRLLAETTNKNSSNLSSMETIFDVIQNFSVREKRCFEKFMKHKNTQKALYYVCLDKAESDEFFAEYGHELMVNISKTIADNLAEECNKLGLVVYYDTSSVSDFIQFRLRRSAHYSHVDLRDILSGLHIETGGGHPGAIGFRIKKDSITDVQQYTVDMVSRIEALLG